jgi:uncharacterized membrane protein YdjX (TVP38/TMEM64 family)
MVSLVGAMTALYLGATALELRVLQDPRPWLEGAGVAPALVGVALLAADAVAPIPSSLVLVALGSACGVLAAVALGLIGKALMAALCIGAGRRGGGLLAHDLSREEQQRARGLVDRWGALAVLVTRPVPLLGETTLLMAGAAGLSWRRAMAAAMVGSAPEVVAYSAAGAVATRFATVAYIWVALLVLCALACAFELRSSRAGDGSRAYERSRARGLRVARRPAAARGSSTRGEMADSVP